SGFISCQMLNDGSHFCLLHDKWGDSPAISRLQGATLCQPSRLTSSQLAYLPVTNPSALVTINSARRVPSPKQVRTKRSGGLFCREVPQAIAMLRGLVQNPHLVPVIGKLFDWHEMRILDQPPEH